jgi:hypothetical protein
MQTALRLDELVNLIPPQYYIGKSVEDELEFVRVPTILLPLPPLFAFMLDTRLLQLSWLPVSIRFSLAPPFVWIFSRVHVKQVRASLMCTGASHIFAAHTCGA